MIDPAELPARLARLKAGLSADEAARRLKIGKPYLLQLERAGAWPWHLAQRGVRFYGCDYSAFYTTGRGARKRTRTRRGIAPGRAGAGGQSK